MYLSKKTKTIHLEECINGFIFHCQYEKNLSGKTINAYTIDLTQFQSYVKGQNFCSNVSNISKDVIKNYLQTIYHYKPKTVKRKMASLKAMFNYLEYENDDFINPFRKIKIRFKEPQILPIVMTINEVKKILSTLYEELNNNAKTDTYTYKSQIRNIAIIELLFATGMRVSELCNLKITDIDIKTGVIKVFGKGSKERIIQICDSEIKSLLKKYRKFYANSIDKDGNFFINRLGYAISTQSVRLMLQQYVQKAGVLKKITPHTFRHTFATLLLEENVDIRYIQNMLGHSTISTTQIYTHVNTESQKRILTSKHPRRKLKFMACE
ncbi:MAG: tyrosine-type recombinase/integrase [Dysgonamonadaceae bacterium]|jgi:integrase/recombinase XerD|nr:tyrosine-type recombinase/integrase [Dysgonamonadaceae bacterium]